MAATYLAPPTSGTAALAALVRDCAAAGTRRQVALLRTGLLPPYLSRPHHHRLARAALDPLLRAERAVWFDLPGGEAAVSWRGDAAGGLAAVTTQLRHLLAGGIDAPAVAELLRVFTLPGGGDALLHLVQSPELDAETATTLPELPRLDAAGLALLEQHSATVDVARFVRRVPVWRLGRPDPGIAWERRILDVGAVTAALLPGCSLSQVPWLYRRLTRAMDRRMLALLGAADELTEAGSFSLDLNIASILSPEFLRFDAALPGRLRGRVTLGVAPEDIAADVPAFTFARDFARVRGYRLLLRAIGADAVALWQFDRLEIDLVELCWSPAMLALNLSRAALGGADWLLVGADTKAAIGWGHAQGIGLFQGRAADTDGRR